MKKSFPLSFIAILFISILSSSSGYAQSVGINTDGSAPHTSAMLDVKHLNKGLLLPRVALTGTDDVTTIATPAISLLVYNTTANGAGATMVTPGYYYWSGTEWLKFSTASAGAGGATAWLLTGNAGTVDATSFMGTTDNVPFNIRVNNQRAGRIDGTSGNSFWGYQAGNSNTTGVRNTANGQNALFYNTTGRSNTANGYGALQSNTTGTGNTANGLNVLFSNTTGNFNTANGVSALRSNTTGENNTANGVNALFFNTTGYNNTANGYNALQSNTTGQHNTANGRGALLSNTDGSSNTANGQNALYSNTTGYYNTANGANALFNNTTGDNNIANGVDALQSNTTGYSNTANGQNALLSNTTGNNNTANGHNALLSNTTGNYNTALGYGADVSAPGLTNATAIGAEAIVNASNKVRIGNSSVSVIEGQVAYSFPSDKRFKYDIKQDVPGLEFIKKLTPVTYYFDEKKLEEYTKTGILQQAQDDLAQYASYTGAKQLHTGFLAQDVEKVAQSLGYNFDGVHAPANNKDHYSLAYSQFIMPLVKSVQEQQVIIETQKADIDLLKAQVAELSKAVKALTHK